MLAFDNAVKIPALELVASMQYAVRKIIVPRAPALKDTKVILMQAAICVKVSTEPFSFLHLRIFQFAGWNVSFSVPYLLT